MSKFQKQIDFLFAANSADVSALEDAKATLEYMQEQLHIQNKYINESLELIQKALNQDPMPTIKKLAKHLKAEFI
jgi:hypothetical protein